MILILLTVRATTTYSDQSTLLLKKRKFKTSDRLGSAPKRIRDLDELSSNTKNAAHLLQGIGKEFVFDKDHDTPDSKSPILNQNTGLVPNPQNINVSVLNSKFFAIFNDTLSYLIINKTSIQKAFEKLKLQPRNEPIYEILKFSKLVFDFSSASRFLDIKRCLEKIPKTLTPSYDTKAIKAFLKTSEFLNLRGISTEHVANNDIRGLQDILFKAFDCFKADIFFFKQTLYHKKSELEATSFLNSLKDVNRVQVFHFLNLIYDLSIYAFFNLSNIDKSYLFTEAFDLLDCQEELWKGLRDDLFVLNACVFEFFKKGIDLSILNSLNGFEFSSISFLSLKCIKLAKFITILFSVVKTSDETNKAPISFEAINEIDFDVKNAFHNYSNSVNSSKIILHKFLIFSAQIKNSKKCIGMEARLEMVSKAINNLFESLLQSYFVMDKSIIIDCN